jgi:hypothetical protein
LSTKPPKTVIAQKSFTIKSDQQKVYKVLGNAIFQCLPLEEMNILDVKNFQAVMRYRLGFINLPLKLKGKLVDVSSPVLLSFVIRVEKGFLQMVLKTTFMLKQIDEANTGVACIAVEDGKRTIIGRITRGQQHDFAMKLFDAMQAQLQKAC